MKHNVLAYNGKGKIGNMVGYSRAGVQMFRAWQPVVANPQTPRQVLSRAKLALASELSRGLANVLRSSYGDMANARVSARNLFTKQVIPVANGIITGTLPSALTVDYTKLPVAVGSLPQPSFDDPDFEDPITVKTTVTRADKDAAIHTDASGQDCAAAIVLVVYNKYFGESIMYSKQIYSETGWENDYSGNMQLSVTVSDRWQGTAVEVYGYLKQYPFGLNGIPTGTEPVRIPGRTSNSVYIGGGNIA